MLEVNIIKSADPVMQLLRHSSHEIFEQAFTGYMLFLFGAADEGVANWFARSLISLDSLTSNDVACFVFARRLQVRASVKRFLTPTQGLADLGAQVDSSGAYSLSS